jgi:hypothetical protein
MLTAGDEVGEDMLASHININAGGQARVQDYFSSFIFRVLFIARQLNSKIN